MSYLGGAKASSSGSLGGGSGKAAGIGHGLGNPAFVIKLVAATDQLQAKPSSGRDNPNTDYLDNLKTGSRVRAKVNKRYISGSVQQIIKNELGDCTYVMVMDQKGKIHKIESTLIKSVGGSTLDTDNASLASANVVENKFNSYTEFLNK